MGTVSDCCEEDQAFRIRMKFFLLSCLVALAIAGQDCDRSEKICPGGEAVRSPCADFSEAQCPNGGELCSYHQRKCSDGSSARKQCEIGKPHCPFKTKDKYPARCCSPGAGECPGFRVCCPVDDGQCGTMFGGHCAMKC